MHCVHFHPHCDFHHSDPQNQHLPGLIHRSSTRFPPNAHSHAAESLAPGQESWGFTLYPLSLFLPRARVHAHTRAHAHHSKESALVPSHLLLKNNFTANEYSLRLLPASAFEVPLHPLISCIPRTCLGRCEGKKLFSLLFRVQKQKP